MEPFNFCPLCSGTFKRESDRLLTCQSCGYHYYINPKPANAVILCNENKEVLLVTRKREPKKGFYDLPGGFTDINETLEESATREVKEELSITVKDFTYIGSFPNRYLYQKVNYYVLTFILVGVGTFTLSDMTPSDDVADAMFVKKKDIPFDHIAFESIEKGLRLFITNDMS